MADDIQNTLGRLEAKIDGLVERADRQNNFLFGRGGLESRLRTVETEQAVVRAQAGLIAGMVSAAVAAIVSLFQWGK